MCFKCSVLASLYKPTDLKNQCRVSSYTAYEDYADTQDLSMLSYPVSLTNISKFENVNDISINVYIVHEKIVKKSRKPIEKVNDELPSECDDSDELPPDKKRMS